MQITILTENNLQKVTDMRDVVEKISITMEGIEAVNLHRWVMEAIVTTCMERMKEERWDAKLNIDYITPNGGGND